MIEAAPRRKLDLSPRPDLLLRDFEANVNKMREILENQKIESLVSVFQDLNSTLNKPFLRAITLLEKAANQRKFTLIPLIARYNQDSEKVHHLRNLLLENTEIKIVFVKPNFEVEGLIYAYHLFIPIPKDMLGEDPKDLLKDHWNLVYETIPYKIRSNLLKRLIPKYTINRVYGWDAAYLAYEVVVIDDGDFWSLPLVNSPFNGIQPFVASNEGEFVILERDETESSKKLTQKVTNDINRRINQYLTFEIGHTIEVPPALIAASIDYSDPRFDLMNATKEFGGKLGPISIDKNLPNDARQLFDLMKSEVFGPPQYIFTDQEIEKYKIVNKWF